MQYLLCAKYKELASVIFTKNNQEKLPSNVLISETDNTAAEKLRGFILNGHSGNQIAEIPNNEIGVPFPIYRPKSTAAGYTALICTLHSTRNEKRIKNISTATGTFLNFAEILKFYFV